MRRESMTPRERWEAVLRREKPDRVPMDYAATAEAGEKLMRHLGVATRDELLARLHIDVTYSVGGRYVGPRPPAGEDIFGCRYTTVSYGTGTYGECTYHPLARHGSLEEIERDYHWPSADSWDYSHIPNEIVGKEDRPIAGGGCEPFLTYCYLRGMEQAFIDLVENPDIVHACLDRLFGLAYASIERIYEQIPGRVLLTYVAEDMGSQESLLFSPAQIRTFLLPRMKRVMDLVHGAGAYVFHHCDGAIRPILPETIAAGIDVLNPVQWRCRRMDRGELKREFGDRIIFHGAMDNQRTLVFGSVADVRREVIDNLSILGAGGGYILAPCHNIQAVSPPENIVAMYETGYHEGWT